MIIDALLKEDVTIYHPLKNGKGEYQCIPYSLTGTFSAFSHGKDIVEFIQSSFLTEAECMDYCRKENKAKETIDSLKQNSEGVKA